MNNFQNYNNSNLNLFSQFDYQNKDYDILKNNIQSSIENLRNELTPKKNDDYIQKLSIKSQYLTKPKRVFKSNSKNKLNNMNNENYINIQLEYIDKNYNNLTFNVNINSNEIQVKDLKNFIISEYPMYFYGKTSNDLIFYFNNSKGFAIELNDDEIIKKFNLLIEIKLRDYYPNFANRFFNKNDYKNNIKSQFPIITKFHSLPSIEDLKLMPIEKLSKINHFTIWNNFGKIEFLNDLNITNINFDNDIILNLGSIEINDNSILHKAEAIISLYNIIPNGENFENNIKKYIEDMNGKFLYYNNNTLIFKFN